MRDGQALERQTIAPDGFVRFARIPHGELQIVARDRSARLVDVALTTMAPGSAELELTYGTTLSVRVEDESGTPVDAVVTAWCGADQPRRYEVAGSSRIGPLPAGLTRLVVASAGLRTAVVEWRVRPVKGTHRSSTLPPIRLERAGAGARARLTGSWRDCQVVLRHSGIEEAVPVARDGEVRVFAPSSGTVGDVHLVVTRGGRDVLSRLWSAVQSEATSPVDLGELHVRQ